LIILIILGRRGNTVQKCFDSLFKTLSKGNFSYKPKKFARRFI
jgi:hypothetical protein